jgi:hypothetical protein
MIERERYRAMYIENIPNKAESTAYLNPETGYFDAWNIISPERHILGIRIIGRNCK